MDLMPIIFSSLALLSVIAIFRRQEHTYILNLKINYANDFAIKVSDFANDLASTFISPDDLEKGVPQHIEHNPQKLFSIVDQVIQDCSQFINIQHDEISSEDKDKLNKRIQQLKSENEEIMSLRKNIKKINNYFNYPLYFNFIIIALYFFLQVVLPSIGQILLVLSALVNVISSYYLFNYS